VAVKWRALPREGSRTPALEAARQPRNTEGGEVFLSLTQRRACGARARATKVPEWGPPISTLRSPPPDLKSFGGITAKFSLRVTCHVVSCPRERAICRDLSSTWPRRKSSYLSQKLSRQTPPGQVGTERATATTRAIVHRTGHDESSTQLELIKRGKIVSPAEPHRPSCVSAARRASGGRPLRTEKPSSCSCTCAPAGHAHAPCAMVIQLKSWRGRCAPGALCRSPLGPRPRSRQPSHRVQRCCH
jgi:hypothetical protein